MARRLSSNAMGQKAARVVRDGLDVLADPHPTSSITDDPASKYRVSILGSIQWMVSLVDARLVPVRSFGGHLRVLLLRDDLDVASFASQNRLAHKISFDRLKRGFQQVLVLRE